MVSRSEALIESSPFFNEEVKEAVAFAHRNPGVVQRVVRTKAVNDWAMGAAKNASIAVSSFQRADQFFFFLTNNIRTIRIENRGMELCWNANPWKEICPGWEPGNLAKF